MNAAASERLTAWMREGRQELSFTGVDGAPEKASGRTARVIAQLRQARLSLERVASPEHRLSSAIRALWRTEARLNRPLRVAILGEINSGKSALANLLAGIETALLPTAVISNTRIPTLLYYASEPEVWIEYVNGRRERLDGDRSLPRQSTSMFRIDVGLPSQRLRTMQILDLPGFICPVTGEIVVEPAAHNVDAAIWCTMSTQAWKETERAAWEHLPHRIAARGVLVATHSDLLRDPSDRQKLMARLELEAGESFKSIVLLATQEALEVVAKDHRGPSREAWAASGAERLESELEALLLSLREQRAVAALRMTSRIAGRALVRIDHGPGGPMLSQAL